jgi:hypothetical protein
VKSTKHLLVTQWHWSVFAFVCLSVSLQLSIHHLTVLLLNSLDQMNVLKIKPIYNSICKYVCKVSNYTAKKTISKTDETTDRGSEHCIYLNVPRLFRCLRVHRKKRGINMKTSHVLLIEHQIYSCHKREEGYTLTLK